MRFYNKPKSHNLVIYIWLALFFCTAVFIVGCKESTMSSSQQLDAFELAGPITPQVDIDQLLIAKNNLGVYVVGNDDVLELQMPTILTAISPARYKNQQLQVEPYLCRVGDNGSITLPIVGQLNVDNKTLAQIEDEIVNLYYPMYIVTRPSVVCSVKEYHFTNITIVGAVEKPGVYQLRSNEMSLVNLLMKAGGIVEGGASLITIKNPQRQYISKSAGEVKQMAEFGSEIDEQYVEYIGTPEPVVQTLQVDIAFRPQDGRDTYGELVVQHGSEKLYSKTIDISDSSQRDEYVKDLGYVIGTEQGYIVGQAIEQLASQLGSVVSAVSEIAPAPAVQLDDADNELINAANEIDESFIETPVFQTHQGCSSCGKNYIETPEPVQNEAQIEVQELKFGSVPVEPAYQPEVKLEPAEEIQPVEIEMVVDENKIEYITPPPSSDIAVKSPSVVEPIVLPVKGLNIPFADVSLVEGDLIEVKKLDPAVFTVIGLAKAPGAFPYPPEVQYNLMQAIGFAGGVDLIADPRFVTVYRQNARGEVVFVTVRIDKKFMASSCKVNIKPGDVISIDVTPRTKRNVLVHQILKINFGLYVSPLNTN
ncbi:MAG: SLBB domain-containing protein [Phycisphaerae bacterium]|nr:SLBB domain-containing protein [Phycisphaerae bacterium]